MFVSKRSHHNPILVPEKNQYWEAFATFNMSVVKKGKLYYGAYRAVSAPDKLRTPEQISTIGLGVSRDGVHFENRLPFIGPVEEWEKFGCEDPRVTYFEGRYYTFYTALSKFPFEASGIKVAVAISKDLKKVKERHLVTPFNAKAMTLFPERINGKITVIFSVHTDMPPAKIAIAQVDTMEELWSEEFWREWYLHLDDHVLNLAKEGRGYDHVEVGATPLRTKHGWLLIYSQIQNYFPGSGFDRIFGIEGIVMDSANPFNIIGRTRGPILAPQEAYELSGYVPNVIFPSGAIIKKDAGKENLYIYYGAADTTVCVAHVNLHDLLHTMLDSTSDRYHFKRYAKNPILSPKKEHQWEATAAFNPAAIRMGGTTHIVYRALASDNTSYMGYASTKDGFTLTARLDEPIYAPREDFENKKVAGGNSGCEDPRITKLNGVLYMCYTAFDGIGPPRVAITSITEKDFLAKKWRWTKPIIITPEGFDDKDTCIFPAKVKSQYFILHRVGNEICGDYFRSLNFSKETVKKCIHIIGPRNNGWDSSKVGIASPPIKTKKGWLLLYHGVSRSRSTYRVGAVLLDLKDPTIVLARSTDPIFEPQEDYEKFGVVPNVVFPCGSVVDKGIVYIYYGGADTVVGVATMKLDTIVNALVHGE